MAPAWITYDTHAACHNVSYHTAFMLCYTMLHDTRPYYLGENNTKQTTQTQHNIDKHHAPTRL